MVLLYLLAGALCFAGFLVAHRHDWLIAGSALACGELVTTALAIQCLLNSTGKS